MIAREVEAAMQRLASVAWSEGFEAGRESAAPWLGLVIWFVSGAACGATLAGIMFALR